VRHDDFVYPATRVSTLRGSTHRKRLTMQLLGKVREGSFGALKL
jgi:hypothetical protein